MYYGINIFQYFFHISFLLIYVYVSGTFFALIKGLLYTGKAA